MTREDMKTRLKKLREEYESRLGQKLSLTDLTGILEAEAENRQCRECEGLPCRKKRNREKMQCVSRENGKIYTLLKDCRYCQYWASSSVKSGVPRRYVGKTYADYIETAANVGAIKAAQRYASEKPLSWLYLYGGCGTGKTFLISLLAKELICAGLEVVFTDFPQILEELKESFDDKAVTASSVLEKYETCEVLMLDDVGTGFFRDWGVSILHQIINARYNAERRTIITSNYDLDGLEKLLAKQEQYSAKRIISRLIQLSEWFYMGEEEDWRNGLE